jgi:dephospho-CoA kinase
MLILGITGGIATGKSTVTSMLERHGAAIVDADAIARALLLPGTDISLAVAAAFPECVITGSGAIDRRALGTRIFADADARRRLEALTHPAIIEQLRTRIRALRLQNDRGIAAVEIPLLFEAGLEELVDRILVVACRHELQRERLQSRLGVSEAEADLYIAAQMPLEEKVRRADFVITTDGSLADTERQVSLLLIRLGL